MPRLARNDIMYNGCYAHVISRSIRKMKIFKEREDYAQLKRLIELTKKRFGFKLFHYCIMQTHFHLVVQMEDVSEFSGAMRYIKSQYCSWFHTKYRLSGPIWRERYRGLLIEDENYLRACGEYIENNPVKTGMVSASFEWSFSSAQYYLKGKSDPLINRCEGYNRIKRDVEIDTQDKQFFEKGNLIGSSFFRFQFYDCRKRC